MRFGYKHVLQRHLARKHLRARSLDSSAAGAADDDDPDPLSADPIHLLTGKQKLKDGLSRRTTRKITCIWYDLFKSGLVLSSSSSLSSASAPCAFAFTRVYDLRRHLKSEHGLKVETQILSEWLGRRSTSILDS